MIKALKICLVFILLSCNKSEIPDIGILGFDYYPLNSGLYRIYEVTEISYEISGFDTIKYYLRETFQETPKDNDENMNYTLIREKRINTADNWRIDSIWTVRKSQNVVVQTENNISYIKLSFPVKAGKQWDQNSNNVYKEHILSYNTVDEKELYGNYEDFGLEKDMIKVNISYIPVNIVNQEEQYEVYVKTIGLIEKKSLTLNFCILNCSGAGEIESGRFRIQQLIEYGNNS